MRLSNYCLPILKDVSNDAKIISHQYSLRAGLIKQISSGLYTWLPLGLQVIKKITDIIREEMNKVGAVELLMPCIQPADLWKQSKRYETYGPEMLKFIDRRNNELVFGPTNEELVTTLAKGIITSYRQLPLVLYQVQWKFRDEIRPRFGIMRSREFLMKDAYSFSSSKQSARVIYDEMYKTYLRIFLRLELQPLVVKASSGQIGGELSHEFHILANTGENTIYYDVNFPSILSECIEKDDIQSLQELYAITEDMYDTNTCMLPKERLATSKGIEVGQIFYFANKYSHEIKACVQDQNGQYIDLCMGSYGIGISRLVGAIIEASHDEKGIIWPEAVAPFKIGLLNIDTRDEQCNKVCEELYNTLNTQEILYDDSRERSGVKLVRMDLIGLPWQVIVSKTGIAQNIVELKHRKTQRRELLSVEQCYKRLRNIIAM